MALALVLYLQFIDISSAGLVPSLNPTSISALGATDKRPWLSDG